MNPENTHDQAPAERSGARNEATAKLPKLSLRTLKVSNKPRRGSLLKSSGQKLSNTSRKVSLLGSSII